MESEWEEGYDRMKEIKIKIKTGIAVFSINLWGNFNLLVTYRLLACLLEDWRGDLFFRRVVEGRTTFTIFRGLEFEKIWNFVTSLLTMWRWVSCLCMLPKSSNWQASNDTTVPTVCTSLQVCFYHLHWLEQQLVVVPPIYYIDLFQRVHSNSNYTISA